MLLCPRAWLGSGEVGSVLENMADARIKQRTRENVSNLPHFATNFLSSLRESAFYLGNLKMDLMFLASFLFMCSHLCL